MKNTELENTLVEEEVVNVDESTRGRGGQAGVLVEEEEEFIPPQAASSQDSEESFVDAEIVETAALEVTTETASEGAENANLVTAVSEIESAIESIIFASPQAISLVKIKNLLKAGGYDTSNTADIIQSLQQSYEECGIQLVKISGGFQFRSHPKNAQVLSRMLEDKPTKLGKSALEVLAIIGYKQPITRAEIDTIRGIDSGHLMRGLMEKNLVRTTGHAETPGRPFLYGTTPYFLEVFSLGSLDDLPSLEDTGRELGESDTYDADAAEFYDKSSPLAAEPDRGDFDAPAEDEVLEADFSDEKVEEEPSAN
ncbi:MAG TPA: SMC-Scp complex subunit ScpB [Bdellovibrionota bacterium]|nr:SMC-Scp complex subunit ScpB [Bdellovibrionota bacterium]